MSRRLFALLAILSGLAVLHAPASAARLDELSYDIEALVDMANHQNGGACLCVRPPQKRRTICEGPSKKAVRPRLVGVQPPPVVVGSDFALE